MKPFDPKTAKNGDKVCHYSIGPFYTYVGPYPKDFTNSVVLDCNNNLMFLNNVFLYCRPTKRTVWVNVYQGSQCYRFNNKETALTFPLDKDYIGTYPLEIEE